MKKLWGAAPFAIVAVTGACGSGLDVYKDPVVDECPQLCADAVQDAAAMQGEGCVVECGIGVAADWHGQATASFFNLVNLWGEVDYDGGTTCDLAVACGEEGLCLSAFGGAMTDTGGDTATASDAFLECLQQQDPICDEVYQECVDDAGRVYSDCMSAGGGLEYCVCLEQEHASVCQCQHDACQTGGDALNCAGAGDCSPLPPPVPLPSQTAPGRFAVSRRFLNAQMGRLDALAAETGVWPVRDPATKAWKGVRLNDIQPGEPLYKVGLRSKDVVRAVNGISVLKAYTQPSALEPLKTANELRLNFERNGQLKQIIYTVVP